jgi:hypothetical protein
MKIDREVDQATARRIIDLMLGGEGETAGEPTPPSGRSRRSSTGRRPARRTQAQRGDGAKRTPRRRAGSPGIVRTLSLRPSGKKPFKTFATEKNPATHQQKQAVIVYWLLHEAGMSQGITLAHVNTCYQEAGWSRPANLENSLATTSARKGWLDTSDYDNITLTTRGEDQVRHELPRPAKSKK